jgi:hypothetical protein
MPYYRVLLRGHNFPGDPIGEPAGRYGFYTTRWVQALSSKRAELKAVDAVWIDPSLAIAHANADESPAWLTVEEMEQVERMPRERGAGATWFAEEP